LQEADVASAALASEPKDISYYLTPQDGAAFGSYEMPRDGALAVMVDDEVIVLPAMDRKLIVQPRQCGDYYAELTGIGAKCATAATRVEAVNAVLAKVSK
jgi:hypothetical protein